MTMATESSFLDVGPSARASRSERHQARTQRSRGPEADAYLQLGLAGTGPVAAVVEPLPEVLAQVVPVAPGREGGGHGVLAGAAGQDGAAHPPGQTGQLCLSEVG